MNKEREKCIENVERWLIFIAVGFLITCYGLIYCIKIYMAFGLTIFLLSGLFAYIEMFKSIKIENEM